ncbi:hypothetical protein [Pelodictyon phaeoclathratiforme]|jgi:hypothetical protein|uniref:SoxXA-binding protein SoxK n=1 Tax=Pelodictyon phaeoclathratiforme (strain DSM 5477 / BU-1) TaxID=324925 RepID=B4SEL3_PELPB|nr:hypothetical protein [Pelodictyon phaeoclathratiforme]ACF43105.1 conserved hypothetical protein [Pelodictyon phaeoclathratiforme BU-1]MBV5289907.1 hypothetical protein [Pelodictyon phaeoclathratiforme]
MKRILLSAFVLLVVFASASELRAEPAAKELIEQAEAKRKEAAAIGFEWRETASLIKSARAALESGQEAEAVNFAGQALQEGEQALAQGKYMQQNWESLVPKP